MGVIIERIRKEEFRITKEFFKEQYAEYFIIKIYKNEVYITDFAISNHITGYYIMSSPVINFYHQAEWFKWLYEYWIAGTEIINDL